MPRVGFEPGTYKSPHEFETWGIRPLATTAVGWVDFYLLGPSLSAIRAHTFELRDGGSASWIRGSDPAKMSGLTLHKFLN